MTSRAFTPANQITILRLIFVPVFASLVISQRFSTALVVLAVAALSDAMDGILARLLKQETPLGVALDPIADKILMTTAYLTLAFRDALPWWLTILVISRDVAILMTALLISLVAGYRPFHPSKLGKASTVVQVATVFVAIGHKARVPLVTIGMVEVAVYLAATLTVASGIHYLIVVRHRFVHHSESEAATNVSQASGQPSVFSEPSSEAAEGRGVKSNR
jgi:cardiolipin synthase